MTDQNPVWRAILALPRGLFRFIGSIYVPAHSPRETREMTERIREGSTEEKDAR
jgi:hypothetical protein